MAHMRKRLTKNGKIHYQITLEGKPDPVTGRNREYETVRCTKREAEARMHEMIAEMNNGGIKKQTTVKLKDWLNTYLTQYKKGIEATTRAGYEEKIRTCINPYIGKYPVQSLNADMMQRWINKLDSEGKSPKTIRNAYNIVNAALKKAIITHVISTNPCEGVELPKLERYEAEIYRPDEIKAALKAAEGTDMYLPLLLNFSLGLRRGELCALKWEHIDFEERVVHICNSTVLSYGKCDTKDPKTKAGKRDIPIGKELIDVLKEARRQYFENRDRLGAVFHDNGYVFCKKDGRQYRPDSITQKWLRFVEKNNLPKIRLHDQRHSNATALIEAGINPKIVQQRLGHSDVTTTLNIYTHVTPVKGREVAETMDNLIFGGFDGEEIRASNA